ncbi:MAG: arginine--tRNA ligase [Deltaproteobacteria bacterium]|jgi:arginyl-tRNA synthetase|nr:arginine--tRNA ligase [Deltaproteobacteria bacterium]
MRAKESLIGQLKQIVAELGLPWPEKMALEAPKDSKFGDIAANIAMVLAKPARRNPRELAAEIAVRLQGTAPEIIKAEVAGPGFINITYSQDFWRDTIPLLLGRGAEYGRSRAGAGKKTQIEFVSANPTGPLHIGHGRGAAIGDSMARIMRFAGYDVQTEYYINDAGKQMRILGYSVWFRLMELADKNLPRPEDWYQGEYIIDIARELMSKRPDLPGLPQEEAVDVCFEYAMNAILDGIKEDLKAFRVDHEIWFSERTLVESGAVDRAFATLTANGHTYEEGGAFWFRTTELGDDKDRVLRKSDGTLTYFASDIAYHSDKFERGLEFVVDVWGADHHGYIPRMRAAVEALGKPRESFEVILVQLVNLMQDGQQMAMSTRAGKFETLKDVMEEVGADAARFMFLSRKSDSPLDFDLELVKQRSMDNPVYYVQYAHARICSMERKAAEAGLTLPGLQAGAGVLARLSEEAELAILRKLDAFPELVASAAVALAPHHVSYYLMELAKDLHGYYSSFPVLNQADKELAAARLYLLLGVRRVLKNGLDLLGVGAPESM